MLSAIYWSPRRCHTLWRPWSAHISSLEKPRKHFQQGLLSAMVRSGCCGSPAEKPLCVCHGGTQAEDPRESARSAESGRMKRSTSNSPTSRGAEAPSTARRHAYSNVLCDRVTNSEIRLCKGLCQLPYTCREEVRRKQRFLSRGTSCLCNDGGCSSLTCKTKGSLDFL